NNLAGTIDTYDLSLYFALPPMLAAVVERILHSRIEQQTSRLAKGQDFTYRLRIIQFTGIVFFVVLTLQSLIFYGLVDRLRSAMSASNRPCMTVDDINGLANSVLDHWSVATYSLVLQGNVPQRIVLEGDKVDCKQDFSTGFASTPHGVEAWTDGHLNLSVIEKNLQ
ncbi:MAG TPA: hypothetical protein VKQ72_11695, partial [Aggregatilineales bacterium]|nr:hypothetical protein [Aggregatilineales bacterium]